MPRLEVAGSKLSNLLHVVSSDGSRDNHDESIHDEQQPAELDSLTIPSGLPSARAKTESGRLLEITPSAGICYKCRRVDGEGGSSGGGKLFVNLCSSDRIPQPEQLTERQLQEAMTDGRAEKLRIPLSMGEAHAELDKSGVTCMAYDVVVHPTLLAQVRQSEVFATFMALVLIDALRSKFSVEIVGESWLALKNKRYLGRMPRHFIRSADMPLVQEFSGIGTVPVADPASGDQLKIRKSQLLLTPAVHDPATLVARATLPPQAGADLRVQFCGRRFLVHSSRAHLLIDQTLPFEPCIAPAPSSGDLGDGGGVKASIASFCAASGRFVAVLRPQPFA